MALDQEYFDAIHIDVVKKKYYNANKVEAVFADIRREAEALNRENEALRRELDSLRGRKNELGQAAISAQDIYRRMIEKARDRSEELLSEARAEGKAIRAAARAQQEESVRQVGACLDQVRRAQEEAIENLNREWQRFLCQLYPEDLPDEAEPPAAPVGRPQPVREPEPEEAPLPPIEPYREPERPAGMFEELEPTAEPYGAPEYPDGPYSENEMPDDLFEKVQAIARELREI